MLNRFSIFTIALFMINLSLVSCDKNNDAIPDNPAYKGDFVSAVHTTEGVATINQETTKLTLTNFKTDNGPDLNIYLSASPSNVTADFKDLGDIKGVNGTYTYDLPSLIDYSKYKYVVVWCVDFNVNFGYAELKIQ